MYEIAHGELAEGQGKMKRGCGDREEGIDALLY
jgi:hypothetical protein